MYGTPAHTATAHGDENRGGGFERTTSVASDALLRRMQHKEREFDAKIHVIHDTFQNAGEQLVMRDSIIAQLQEELADLRRESDRIPAEYQAREQKLLLRVESMMRELREEQTRTKQHRHTADDEAKRLRAARTTADQQLAQQQRVSDDLLRQLRASDKALHEAKVKHAAALQEGRQVYEQKLAEVERAYHSVEKELVKARVRGEDAERDRAEGQARLLEHEMEKRRWHTSESHKAKALAMEKTALQEEVEAVRLSMARLLHLLADVPAMANYLQWNELSSEFVFLGYPTRYFANGAVQQSRHASRHTSPPARRRAGAAATTAAEGDQQRSGSGGHESGGVRRFSPATPQPTPAALYYHDVNVSGGSFAETGVDDGVYAGVASSLSKNVWLNGRWAQQMMDIIAAENNFTRLKRIKLLELEEAAQLSEQLPSSRDVLEGRKPEQDYWIPYAVFTEAQRFKNKYYPKLPAMSHFYPFLIQLNKIWQARLHDRLRVRQRSPQQQQQQQQGVSSFDISSAGRRSGHRVALEEGEVNSRVLSRSMTGSQLSGRRSEELLQHLLQSEGRVHDLQAEHHRLRREVRLHISSQRSLRLFSLYDELVRGAHRSLVEVAQMATELHDGGLHSPTAARSWESQAEARMNNAADTLRAEQLQAQMEDDISAAIDSRDRLSCVIERTCERVCSIGDTLSSRMASYYSDLHQLIQMLHSHLRDARTRGDTNGMANDSSSGSGGAVVHRWHVSSAEAYRKGSQRSGGSVRQSVREALEGQYGATRGLAAGGRREDGTESPSPPPLPSGSGPVSEDALLKLAASFLDFGEEMRKEVADASAALHEIAEQAMSTTSQQQQRAEEEEG